MEIQLYNRKLIILCIALAFIPLLINALLMIVYAPISCDPAYYLTIVNHIANGDALYSDVSFGYTPLYVYFLFCLKTLFHVGVNYSFWLSVQMLISLICGIYIFKISTLFCKRWWTPILAMWLYYASFLISEAAGVFLETPSMTVGIILTYYIVKQKQIKTGYYFLIGILATLPFWCKQYGIGFFLIYPFLFCGYSDYKQHWIKFISLYIAGGVSVFLVCWLLFPECIESMYNGYGTNSAASSFFDSIFHGVPQAIVYYCKRYFACAIFGLVPLLLKNKNWYYIGFCLAGVCGFLMQFYFNNAIHYFQYVVPFSALLVAFLVDNCFCWKKWSRYLFLAFFVYSVVMLSYMVCWKGIYREYVCKNIRYSTRQMQQDVASKVSDIVDAYSKDRKDVLIKNEETMFLFYFANMSASKFKGKCHYGFGPLAFDKVKYEELIKASDIIIDYPESQSTQLEEVIHENISGLDKIGSVNLFYGPFSEPINIYKHKIE